MALARARVAISATRRVAAARCPRAFVHGKAFEGFRDDTVSSYEAGRPSYPEEAVQFLVQHGTPQGAPPSWLELGAGTGKFTRCLLAARPGADITAVEPTTMGTALQALPGVSLLAESADAMPSIPTASVDAVFAAQAFHWFATASTLAEVHRVLRPGGGLGLVWNTTPDVEMFVNKYYTPDIPRQQNGKWRQAFEEAQGLFGPPATHTQTWTHCVTRSAALQRVLSISVVAALPQPQLAAAEAAFGEWLGAQVANAQAAIAADNKGVVYRDDQGCIRVRGCLARLVPLDEGHAVDAGDTVTCPDGSVWGVQFALHYTTDAFYFPSLA